MLIKGRLKICLAVIVVQIKSRLEICQFCNNSRTNNKLLKNLSQSCRSSSNRVVLKSVSHAVVVLIKIHLKICQHFKSSSANKIRLKSVKIMQ